MHTGFFARFAHANQQAGPHAYRYVGDYVADCRCFSLFPGVFAMLVAMMVITLDVDEAR